MTIYQKIKEYLVAQPKARERSNKNRVIGNLMIHDYSLEISKDKMADMVGEILNADRAWRKVLEDNKDLRGTDYADKDELELLKQQELGYRTK